MPDDIGLLAFTYICQLREETYELQQKASISQDAIYSLWRITLEAWFLEKMTCVVGYLKVVAEQIEISDQNNSSLLLKYRDEFLGLKVSAWETLNAPIFANRSKSDQVSVQEYCLWVYGNVEKWANYYTNAAFELEKIEMTLTNEDYLRILRWLIFNLVETAADMKSLKTIISSMYYPL